MSKFSLYGTFTIEDADNVGRKFKAKCINTRNYESDLTNGKTYEIEITPRILPMSPLCKLIGDSGRKIECHLERFDQKEKV